MKKILLILVMIIFSSQSIYAYSLDDVTSHNSPSDCWVVFENKVYDLTSYLVNHDRYMDIREWCGKDMTQDFITKADSGRDHKPSTYALLDQYLIGDIETIESNNNKEESTPVEKNQPIVEEEKTIGNENPYNLAIPLLLSTILYWLPFILIKKQKTKIQLKSFNGFWNSILILLLFVPAMGFGIYMILRYKFPSLWNTDFDFMYWHVELSLTMGILAIYHLVQRVKMYFSQLKIK